MVIVAVVNVRFVRQSAGLSGLFSQEAVAAFAFDERDVLFRDAKFAVERLGGFDDRPQYLYDQFTNPEGLHAEAWDVTGADYNATVFFETQGDTDYRVEGRAEFVVARDKSKAVDAPGAWLIYRWTDLGAAKPSAAPAM